MGKLVLKNLLAHPVRSILTVGSLMVALFLLCFLRSLVTALGAGIEAADSSRLWVQSAVSLFVDLPTSYQPKIESVDGVVDVGKWQWFGGYYQDPSNFFGQFAVDPEEFIAMYPEVEIIEGSADDFLARRTSCIVGSGIASQFGWSVGDTVPLIGALFPKPGGEAWEFEIAAIYNPTKPNFDDRTFLFHWEYFNQTQREITGSEPNVGTFVATIEPGTDATRVMADIDRLFENGPQRVQATTEAEFSRQFVSMIGNLPRFLGFLGSGVFVAILLACINTMLMAGREQTHDVGILKALGFSSGAVLRLQLAQSFVLCGLGGGLGILLSLAVEPVLSGFMSSFFPGYAITSATLMLAVGITLAIGLLAGIVPAVQAAKRPPVNDLRATV